MQRMRLTHLAAVVLLGAGLVACGEPGPACAAPTPTPFDALRMPAPPKPPPTSRSQYRPPHRWGHPYGNARPTPYHPAPAPHTDCRLTEGNPDHD